MAVPVYIGTPTTVSASLYGPASTSIPSNFSSVTTFPYPVGLVYWVSVTKSFTPGETINFATLPNTPPNTLPTAPPTTPSTTPSTTLGDPSTSSTGGPLRPTGKPPSPAGTSGTTLPTPTKTNNAGYIAGIVVLAVLLVFSIVGLLLLLRRSE